MTGAELLAGAALTGAWAGLCVEVGLILGVYASDFNRRLKDGLSHRRRAWLWLRHFPVYTWVAFSVDRDDWMYVAKWTVGFAAVGATATVVLTLLAVGLVEVVG